MIEKREQLINDLKNLSAEIQCEEMESNQSILDTIQVIINYFECDKETLKGNEITDKEDLIDTIKSLLNELMCDNCNESTINILKNVLAELETV